MRLWLAAAAVAVCARIAVADTVSETQYARALERAADGLQRAAASTQDRKAAVDKALATIPAKATVVSASGGRPVTVDNSRLLSSLRREAAKGAAGARRAAEVVRSLRDGITPSLAPAPASARAAFARVLQRPEFRVRRPSRLQELLERLRERVRALIGRALSSIGRGLEKALNLLPPLHIPFLEQAWGIMRILVIVVGCGLALLILYRLVMRLAGRRTATTSPTTPPPLTARAYGEWLAEAEAAAGSQDYRKAVRALHMAALMRLDDAGYVNYGQALADGRFVRSLRAARRRDLADILEALNRIFGRAWYGMALTGPVEYNAAHAQWTNLEAAIAP